MNETRQAWSPLDEEVKKAEKLQEKEEAKVQVKETPKNQELSEREAPRVLVSTTDAYVHERMKSQPKTLADIKVEASSDPNRHRLSLPLELEAYGKQYAFRWLLRNKQALDEALDGRGWLLVKRIYFQDLPDHLFTINGSIERGANILGFMPIEKAEKLRREPGQKSNQVLQGTFDKHKNDPRYYAPKGDLVQEMNPETGNVERKREQVTLI